ncbi:DUF5710 domain-containing protein [Ekhidna sp.]|uniref:DUF5710 domain-containing protein n=1 Tax=Ekhidna sp. TaxID=2608089 RepID=UPI003CCBA683
MPLKIDVPFKDKDEAKARGAFWEAELKTWYVPNHKKYDDFLQWINSDDFSIIAQTPFYIAKNQRKCWRCSELTTVVSLASNRFFELDYLNEGGNDEAIAWFPQNYFTFFSSPTYINKETIDLISQKFPFYKLGFSKTINGKYWANHCEKCNSLQGDFFNHNEPGGAFSPMSIEECQQITLMEVPAKFDLAIQAGTGWSSLNEEIIELSKRVKWDDI